jgi:hypothetical protein
MDQMVVVLTCPIRRIRLCHCSRFNGGSKYDCQISDRGTACYSAVVSVIKLLDV